MNPDNWISGASALKDQIFDYMDDRLPEDYRSGALINFRNDWERFERTLSATRRQATDAQREQINSIYLSIDSQLDNLDYYLQQQAAPQPQTPLPSSNQGQGQGQSTISRLGLLSNIASGRIAPGAIPLPPLARSGGSRKRMHKKRMNKKRRTHKKHVHKKHRTHKKRRAIQHL